MLGYVIKDLLVLKKYLKTIMFFCVFYGVLQGVGSMSGVSVMIMLIATIGTISSMFAYDDMAHWDKLVFSFPVPRKKVVLSRYLSTTILLLAAAVAGALIEIIGPSSLQTALITLAGGMAVAIIELSILIPLNYKVGREKAYIFFLGFHGLIAAAAYVGVKIVTSIWSREVIADQMTGLVANIEQNLVVYIIGAVIAICFAAILSFHISAKVYGNEEA